MERTLNLFQVFCSRRGEGCDWKGELSALGGHLNENPVPGERLAGCNSVEVNCAHCEQPILRRNLNAHEETECQLRPYNCDHCGEFASSFEDVVVNHHPVCERYPLPCPNKCDEIPEGVKYATERRYMERHVKEECLLTVVECDFHYAGCEARLPRKDMASHLAESLVTHMSLMATHGRNAVTEAQRAANEAQRALEMQMAEMNTKIQELEEENKSLKTKLHSYLLTPPITFTMTNFAQHRRSKYMWHSPPFYTHPHGYKVYVKVLCRESSFFVGVSLMRGKFDDHLLWPFQNIVYIRLLNQHSDKDHIVIAAKFDVSDENVSMRVTEGERHLKGRGDTISYAALDNRGDCTRAYVKDDTIQLQVANIVDCLEISRLERHIHSTINPESLCMPPHRFIMTDFEQLKQSGHIWYSPSIYTHREGYRMCLRVDANGNGDGKGTHVSLYSYLMRGKFDSHLKWPFRGNITIQLLNQLKNKRHWAVTIPYTNGTSEASAARVTDGERSLGRGKPKFIPHSALGLSVASNCQYLKDDCLMFRVAYIDRK